MSIVETETVGNHRNGLFYVKHKHKRDLKCNILLLEHILYGEEGIILINIAC